MLFYWIVAAVFSLTFYLSVSPEARKRKPIYSALLSLTIGLTWPVTLGVCLSLAILTSMGARNR